MLLKDYYNQTVSLNESKIGGWSQFYYGIVSKVINENNFKIIAEVGIGYGTHAKELLQNTNIDKLYLIDPMQYYPNDQFTKDIMSQISEIPNNKFNELYDLINNELKPWNTKYTWYRKPSLSITEEEIPSNSLDCIFIDGDHSYEAVYADLKFWWKKLRTGGHILGDDYWIDDVEKAVIQFSNDMNINPDFLTLPNNTYKIYRFIKL